MEIAHLFWLWFEALVLLLGMRMCGCKALWLVFVGMCVCEVMSVKHVLTLRMIFVADFHRQSL